VKFSIGDKVILKRTGEEGVVTAPVNNLMVEVTVNGISFPVYIDDIDHPYLEWFTNKSKQKKKNTKPAEQIPVEKQEQRRQRLAKGVYLSFFPVYRQEDMEDVVDHMRVYLLNELPQQIKFAYDVRFAHQSQFKHEGNLHGFGNVYLHHISYSDMNDQPRFHWTLSDPGNVAMDIAEGVLRIRPAKLFEHINKLLKDNEPSFSYSLITDFKPRPKPEQKAPFESVKKPQYITSRYGSGQEPAKYELDLHIEQLIADHKGMSNAEILRVQLSTLQRYLHLAIVHHQDRMIVIHGLGKGKLREEVHAILKRTPEVSRFKNEWSGKYGFGATEIWFKR